jgi:hypothetical protein
LSARRSNAENADSRHDGNDCYRDDHLYDGEPALLLEASAIAVHSMLTSDGTSVLDQTALSIRHLARAVPSLISANLAVFR